MYSRYIKLPNSTKHIIYQIPKMLVIINKFNFGTCFLSIISGLAKLALRVNLNVRVVIIIKIKITTSPQKLNKI